VKELRIVQCIAVLVIGVLAAASPAGAQNQYGGGHSGITTEYTYSGNMAWKDLNAFGQCFAKRQTGDALKLVRTDAGSTDEARVYKALFSKEQFCLGDLSGLTVPWKFVRGAVGEGLYSAKVPLPAALSAPPQMAREKVQSVMDAAICYAGQHPSDARRLVETTTPDSKEEADAIEALTKDFSACLPPNMPQKFSIDVILLRYRIAEALWRLGMVHS
jgi:hypothetical protein